MRRLSFMLAGVCLLAALPAAQSPRTATIDAIVTDRDGQPMSGLTAGDFRVVTADGTAIPVIGVRGVTIPPGTRGIASAAGEAPLDATNQHAPDARLFVVVVEPVFFDPNRRGAREFVDDLVAGMSEDDQLAMFVAGFPERSLPPTRDATVIARALSRLPATATADPRDGLTWFMRNDIPKIYQSLMSMQWAQRAIVLLTPGYAGPDAFYDYKSWDAWSQRANAPMHGVDVIGGPRGFGQPLLRQAAEETKGLVFVNQSSMKGIAPKILAASSRFYEVQVEVPAGVKTDQSFYTSVKTQPTSKTRARLRVRVAEPHGLTAHATNELRNALAAPLPMDELPLSFSVESTVGSTAATLTFLGTATRGDVVELPAGPFKIGFAALTDAGKIQQLGGRDLQPEDVKIEGCCLTVHQDLIIPKNAISLRVAVYQQPTGKVGAVFLPIEKR